MTMAYEALPQALKDRIEGLEGDYVYGGVQQKSRALLDAGGPRPAAGAPSFGEGAF